MLCAGGGGGGKQCEYQVPTTITLSILVAQLARRYRELQINHYYQWRWVSQMLLEQSFSCTVFFFGGTCRWVVRVLSVSMPKILDNQMIFVNFVSAYLNASSVWFFLLIVLPRSIITDIKIYFQSPIPNLVLPNRRSITELVSWTFCFTTGLLPVVEMSQVFLSPFDSLSVSKL